MNRQSLNFNEKCYPFLKSLPKGRVTTYKEIANALNTKAYRAVGNAMANMIDIPCHRVVKSNAEVGNYALGIAKKIVLLEQEGVNIKNGKVQSFSELIYSFKRTDTGEN